MVVLLLHGNVPKICVTVLINKPITELQNSRSFYKYLQLLHANKTMIRAIIKVASLSFNFIIAR